ncbi:MAG: hypothetical protein FWF52_03235 [Candidatus Azobacteroides sp.]|nr:hypothetical protein [Candidatus Azobacteroides sp.]
MKNYVLGLITVAVILVSCKDNNEINEGYFLSFRPRQVKSVFITFGEKQFRYYEGVKYFTYYGLEAERVAEDQFFISILSSNYDPRTDIKDDPDYDPTTPMPIYYPPSLNNLDDPIPSVEQQIELDCKKWSRSGEVGGKDYMTMIYVEYRTTEIKLLNISALNTPLFGKTAGEPLNDFFTIIAFKPPVIVSAPTERLVYGYSSREYPTSIDEWLSLSPFGQSVMWLEPNRKIEGLPLQVQFVVQMETADGLMLSDTTRVITIQKSVE